ncbi:hypothetical protein ABNQ39_17095 [Azospirillum sp. A26]|uniref:hypothetical protein n=1 Tax=Azospirillum sp. A26 TaxID=3160607 RepID=UPI00367168E8
MLTHGGLLDVSGLLPFAILYRCLGDWVDTGRSSKTIMQPGHAKPLRPRLARFDQPADTITVEMMREDYGAEMDVPPAGNAGMRVCVHHGLHRRA